MTYKNFLPMINRIIKSVLIIQLLLINYTVQAQCPVDSITQNESFNLDFGGLTSCGDLTNNSFFRVFDLSAEFGITEDYQIDSVTFGSAVFFSDPNVSEARGYVNIYSLEAGLDFNLCLLYTSPSPRDKRQSRMPSSA